MNRMVICGGLAALCVSAFAVPASAQIQGSGSHLYPTPPPPPPPPPPVYAAGSKTAAKQLKSPCVMRDHKKVCPPGKATATAKALPKAATPKSR